MPDIVPSIQDYSLVNTHVTAIRNANELRNDAHAFYFFSLGNILRLQDDEIEDAITDNDYLASIGSTGGHDRGVDALYIDESEKTATIHIFNCKYRMSFEKISNFFPAVEIDKISGFLGSVMRKDTDMKDTVNSVLFQKVQNIWDLFNTQNPNFVIHITTNGIYPFAEDEKKRFENDIGRYSHISIEYDLLDKYVRLLTHRGRKQVDALIHAIDTNTFEKSDGDIRALIVNFDARDLLRIVIDNNEARMNADPDDYSIISETPILEDAFEDNVRVYLRQRSKINRNIKETAKSEDSHRFFYFNNGITLTCSSFSYPTNRRNPLIRLKNLQIVNGSQTIHALYEAFQESPDNFNSMDILCRIYETDNEELCTDIAEYTNSQNPVKSRDIRSNDFVQKKLDSELSVLGYFYERKKNQYFGEDRQKRIDAEKAGQALMAFYNKLPAEAKNDKRLIFAEKYDEVFSDDITAEEIITAIELYNEIERRKMVQKAIILSDPAHFEENSYILHATYYVMYAISEMADLDDVSKVQNNYNKLIGYYDLAIDLMKKIVEDEKNKLEGYTENYTHRMFFKGNRPKKYLEERICMST